VTAKRRWVVRRIKGTKREAERALRALAAEVDAGQHKGTEGTVAHLLETWYDHASPGWSPTTRQEVRLVVRRRLVPALGSLRLSELRPGHLDGLYRAMTADGLSPATVRKAHNAMSRALRQAVRWGWVPQSVAASASPPPVRQAPIVPPSPAVVTQLIETAEGLGRTDLAVLVRLAASTGARRGELCGLRWSDIDDRAATLTVRRSVVTGEGVAGGWLFFRVGRLRLRP
jgi:integrase